MVTYNYHINFTKNQLNIQDLGILDLKRDIISVKNIVRNIIENWGGGKYKIFNKKLFYEQKNLQLNIKKSNKILKWYPKFSIKESISTTVEWYKFVHLNGTKSAEFITKKQINSYLKKIINFS